MIFFGEDSLRLAIHHFIRGKALVLKTLNAVRIENVDWRWHQRRYRITRWRRWFAPGHTAVVGLVSGKGM
jgi:hypothetical protein